TGLGGGPCVQDSSTDSHSPRADTGGTRGQEVWLLFSASVARCSPSARRKCVPTVGHTSLNLKHRGRSAWFFLEIAHGSFRASSSHMNVDLPALEALRER